MSLERTRVLLWLAAFMVAGPLACPATQAAVKAWEQDEVIPTYLMGDPEPNPMFYFGRVSQGAEGRVYPYPLYDTLTGEKADKTYKMVYLENEYLRIGILPEVGGRIFEGLDKTNGYNFFYRQHVIKPALIGLIGAWISGGVEWNIPHHHRATTCLPVQYRIEENEDGSRTVWVGELEVRHRMEWAVGYTLHPGSSVLQAQVRIVNRTPVVNTMLCFANAAVHVNDDYQVIFPPSTQYVTYHSKTTFASWPIATTRYAGADFTGGVDVSWYKNHISSNSMFAWNYEDDFFAGYDHGREAGTMSVADHHVVPGKKFWTWGNGPRGRMWDHILTDEDGPYIELMVGAYSDNQPDYSWLQPYEVKSFQMNWYPFRGIGGVKSANLDAAVNLEVKDGAATLGFYTTRAHRRAEVLLEAGEQTVLQETVAIDPGRPYLKKGVPVPPGIDEHDLRASLSAEGKELVAYSPVRLESKPMPAPVTPPAPPEKIATNEELYLTGLRIEQFHDPSREPDPYWKEALRRDPGDVRVNTALGINYLQKARYEDAERLLRKALERLTDRYTTPKDAEATYYLGVALKTQGKCDEAFDTFYKATWSMAWRAASYYACAEIACARGDMPAALDLLDRSLEANALNIRAINLKAAVLRHMGRSKEARRLVASSAHETDPLDVRSTAEWWLASKSDEFSEAFTATMNRYPATAQEVAAEYLDAGLWQDGTAVLERMIAKTLDKSRVSPLVYYCLAYFADKMGRTDKAAEYCRLAQMMSPDYVFPFQDEAIAVLEHAMKVDGNDARAPYYLGNLLYDWQPARAIALWEKSASLDPSFAIVHRNLGIAYSHEKGDDALDKAIASLERAVALPTKYAMHFAELDELYESRGVAPEQRLALLEANQRVVEQRDDALSRMIRLKVLMGKYDEAIALMTGRQFEVWEGGSLTVAESWTDAHLLRGHERLAAKRCQEALADYQAAGEIPDNLPSERRGFGGREGEIAYFTGVAYEGLGDMDRAKQSWAQASGAGEDRSRFGPRGFGGGARPYYQAMALRKLGDEQKAAEILHRMIESAESRLNAGEGTASFAAFGRPQSPRSRSADAHFAAGLGYLGLGDVDKAKEQLNEAIKASPDHLGTRAALAHLDLLAVPVPIPTWTSDLPVQVVFEGKTSEHKWSLEDLGGLLPADWSGYNFLVVEMKTSSPQRFAIWIYTSDGKRRMMFHPFGQGLWMRASIPLQYFKGKDQRGMDLASTNNRRTDIFYMGVWGPFGELKNVESISVTMQYPLNKPTLEVRSIRLCKDDPGSEFLEGQPVVDEFGQWAHGDWPRKIKSREQLQRELAEEQKSLIGGDEFDYCQYGGYKNTQAKATGFFRVEQIDGRWWFVDPDGHLFLSTGSNCMRAAGGRGAQMTPAAANLVQRRMSSWGMNTVGNWSSLRPSDDGQRKACVVMFRGPRSEPSYLGMPDVYSDEFAQGVEQAAQRQCSSLKSDPWLLGYFLGNEPPWEGRESELVDMFLKGPDTATRRRCKEYLAQGDGPRRREELVYGMFERYLALMSDAIKKYDPNHLNLGIRFGGAPRPAVMKLGKSFDVCSINVYEYEPTRQLKALYEATGRPMLIGEFHFGVPADGLGAGLVQTASQAERAKGYRYYVEQVAALPGFLGAHWFQWADEPVLGRMDGENYNIGFVDCTDRPYPELVEAAKATHKRLYDVHSGKLAPFDERPRASQDGTPDSPW
jgi:tetratricopeptide (TPR) repeat protein